MQTHTRQSNLELLRIIIMFMILMIHASMKSFSFLNGQCTLHRALIGSFSITAVNIFILITGWFGTGLRFGKIINLLFQVAFISCVSAGLMKTILPVPTGMNSAYFFFWFIFAYICLVVLSPLLNHATKNLSQKGLLTYIILFYGIYLLLDPFVPPLTFRHGYHTLWFAVLYLVGRYLRLYGLPVNTKKLALIFIACLLTTSCLATFSSKVITYANPFILICSICFFIAFTRMRPFQSRFINFVAASTTMVYLLNDCQAGEYFYMKTIKFFYETYPALTFTLYTIALMVAYYVVAILIDQVRKGLYYLFMKIFGKSIASADARLKSLQL